MSAIILAIIIVLALVLFISEWVRIDVVALLIMGALMVTGILTPSETIQGFSNSATITVLFMFILSAALVKTGVLSHVGAFFARMFNIHYALGLVVMILCIAFISAFINNTPVVAIFIPVAIQVAKDTNIPASKLLMPVSFAAIFGGTCTLIGTSTNILVDGIAESHGVAGLDMFTLTPIGLSMLVVGTLYMATFGWKLLPDRQVKKNAGKYHLREYITEIELLDGSRSVGKTISKAPLVTEYNMDILQVLRQGEIQSLPSGDFVLKAGDILKVRCNVERLQMLKNKLQIDLRPSIKVSDHHFGARDTSLVELIIAGNSRFEGKTMQEVNFRQRYRAIPLAIKHREDIIHERLMNTPLKAGDVILVEIKNNRLEKLREEELEQNQPFILITEHKNTHINWLNFAIVALAFAGVILLETFNILDIVGGTLIASALLILTRCLPAKEMYDVVDWKVIIMLGGSLSLGIAMEKTGLSVTVANMVIGSIGSMGPAVIVSALYLFTMILTEIMSNNATAALLAPIAISTALQLGLSPTPFLVAITMGASACYLTPVGYQTNAMVYSAGGYKFTDFFRVGTGLSLIYWLMATFLIPLFYDF